MSELRPKRPEKTQSKSVWETQADSALSNNRLRESLKYHARNVGLNKLLEQSIRGWTFLKCSTLTTTYQSKVESDKTLEWRYDIFIKVDGDVLHGDFFPETQKYSYRGMDVGKNGPPRFRQTWETDRTKGRPTYRVTKGDLTTKGYAQMADLAQLLDIGSPSN